LVQDKQSAVSRIESRPGLAVLSAIGASRLQLGHPTPKGSVLTGKLALLCRSRAQIAGPACFTGHDLPIDPFSRLIKAIGKRS
jgi:hypothetical protein